MMPSKKNSNVQKSSEEVKPAKSSVVTDLEQESKEGFKAKRAIAHPLPKEMVKRLAGFLDKYGEDYEVRLVIFSTEHSMLTVLVT